MKLLYRYFAHAPNGDPLGPLPTPSSSSFSGPLNEVSACTLSYMPGSPGYDLLEGGPVEISVEASFDNGETWSELPNGRFMRVDRDYEKIGAFNLRKYTLPGIGWQLNKAIQWKTTGLNADGKRPFLSASVGTILKALIDEAHSRGTLPWLTYNFTATRDSAGELWDKIISIYYEPGLGLYQILDNLAQQSMCDWQLVGRELQLFNADKTLASVAPNVTLHPGVDIKALPIKASISEMVNRALVIGDGGTTLVLSNDTIAMPWGNWESSISNSGVSDQGTMNILGKAILDSGSEERIQYTAEIKVDTTTYYPFHHYKPGQYIEGPGEGASYISYRIRQINGSSDADGNFKIDLVLNDRFTEREIRNAKRTKGIVGGSSAGGSGGRPSPIEPGVRKPKAPTDLRLNSTHYFDAQGVAHSAIQAAFEPPTEDTEGQPLTISTNELFGREVGSTEPYRLITSVGGSDSHIAYSPLPVHQTWSFMVRAIAENGIVSDWSNVEDIELAQDIDPPPVPSDPILTTRLGTITIQWDGKTADGGQMPIDFDYCLAEYSKGSETGFESIGELRNLTGSNFLVVADLPYEQLIPFRLRSVDSSGNLSEPSSVVTIATAPLVDGDLVGTTIQQAIEDIESQVDYAVQAANGKNTNYYGPNIPTPPTGGHQLNDTWYQEVGIAGEGSSVIIHTWSGSNWVAKQLGDGALAVGSITATNGVIASLDAAVIGVGILNADRIGSKTITADKILVGSSENLLVDPTFSSAKAWHDSSFVVPPQPDGSGGYAFLPPGALDRTIETGDPQWTNMYLARVEAGAEYNFSAYLNFSGGTIYLGSAAMQVAWMVGGVLQVPIDIAYATWGWATGVDHLLTPSDAIVAPAGATHVSLIINKIGYAGSLIVKNPSVKRVMNSVLIADGAVTAPKIVAGAITADKIETNAITADKILAGAISAVKISANAIDATRLQSDAITAKHVITGATIQTTATNYRGIKIYDWGLFLYNAAGQPTVFLEGATGNATLTGELQTGLGNNQVVIADGIFRGRPGMRLDTGSSHDVQPTIQSLGVGSSGFTAGDFVINGRETTVNSTGRADLILKHGGDFALKQNWGPRSGVGVEKTGDFLNLTGRMEKTTSNRTLLHAGESSTWTNINPGSWHEWQITYGTPPAVGTRVPLLALNTSGALLTGISAYSASGFSARTHNTQSAGTPGYNVHYMVINK